MSVRSASTLTVLLVGGITSQALSQVCQMDWSEGLRKPGEYFGAATNGRVRALAVLDLGDGPCLVIGGDFTQVAGIPAMGIAMWNGVRWRSFGDGLGGGQVRAVALFDEDGTGSLPPRLVAGGSFQNSGSTPCRLLARWDVSEQAWEEVPDQPYSLDPEVGLGSHVNALATAHGRLYVGGQMSHALSGSAYALSSLWSWDGSAWNGWSEVQPTGCGGPGDAQECFALYSKPSDGNSAVPDGLYAAGFLVPDPSVAPPNSAICLQEACGLGVARLDGVDWHHLGDDLDNGCGIGYALAYGDDDDSPSTPNRLLVGGSFQVVGSTATSNIAAWTMAGWSSLAGGVGAVGEVVRAICLRDTGDGGRVYAGGGFELGTSGDYYNIARYETASGWSNMGAYPHSINVPVSQVDAIAAYGDGVESNALYVGGTFVENSTDPTSCSYLARWAAAQPVIMEQPRGKLSEGGAATAQFCVRHATTPAAEFQWFLNGTPIADDPPRVTGATTQKLVIDGTASQDAGTYAVEITNGCGTAVSEGAFCPADFNTDASVDDFDYFDFMNAFTSSDPSADFNEDSSIDDFDYFDFLTSLAAGC